MSDLLAREENKSETVIGGSPVEQLGSVASRNSTKQHREEDKK